MCVTVCVRIVCVCVCVRACVRACVCVCITDDITDTFHCDVMYVGDIEQICPSVQFSSPINLVYSISAHVEWTVHWHEGCWLCI